MKSRGVAGLVLCLTTLCLAACGGEEGSTAAPTTAASAGDGAASGSAAEFENTGADNSIQAFGAEASKRALDQAAAALHGYLDARAAHAWSDACSHLADGMAASMARVAGGGAGSSCPELLAALSAGLPPSTLRKLAVADIGAFRVEGSRGFLLFHGAGGRDYFIPMNRDSEGTWKVGAIAPSALSW